jgi:hypothetical protein
MKRTISMIENTPKQYQETDDWVGALQLRYQIAGYATLFLLVACCVWIVYWLYMNYGVW